MAVSNIINISVLKLLFDAVHDSDTLDEVADRLTQLLVAGMGLKGATIFAVNHELEELEVLGTFGLSAEYVNKGPILVDKSIRLPANREPVIISDVTKSNRLQYPDKAKKEGIGAIISVPITLHGRIIGALRLYHDGVWEITDHDMEYLQVLCLSIGLTMMNFRLLTALSEVKEIVNEVHPIWMGR